MAKAQLKGKELPAGMQAKDLSIEKRTELFQALFDKFAKEAGEQFGLGLGAEIVWTPRAAVPRLVVVDLLKKDEEGVKAKA